MNGGMTKKCGLSFKGCNRIPVHQIHLHGKMICYGTKIAYIYAITPNSKKRYYWKNKQINIVDKIPVQTIFPELDEEGKIILEPKAITDTRIRQLRNRSISEYLIKWRKLLAEDSTWEDESFIQKHLELLKHCRQHLSQGEGHVKP
jgi:hypothetical protein